MESFSKKDGCKPVKSSLHTRGMDDDLRNNLWNALCIKFWNNMDEAALYNEPKEYQDLTGSIWLTYFKKPVDMTLTLCKKLAYRSFLS